MKQHAETHFRGKGRGRGRKALGDEVADEGGGYEDDEEEGENDEGVKGGQGRRRANRGMSAREASEMVRQLMEEQKKRVASTAQLERERVREREQREQREHIAAALDAGSCRENIGEVIPGSQLRRAESGSETVPTAGSGRTVVPPPSKRQSLIATSAAAAAASMNASRAKPQSPIASITSRTVVPGSRQSHFETNPKPVTKSRPPLERVGTSLGSLTSDASASSGGSGGSGASSQSGTSSNTASNDGGSADGSALASSAGSGSGSGSGSDSDPRPAKAARHGNGNGNGRGVGGIGVKERRVQLGRVEDGTWRGQDELQLERQRERGVVGLSVLADAATQVECGKGTGRGNRR